MKFERVINSNLMRCVRTRHPKNPCRVILKSRVLFHQVFLRLQGANQLSPTVELPNQGTLKNLNQVFTLHKRLNAVTPEKLHSFTAFTGFRHCTQDQGVTPPPRLPQADAPYESR